jgi:hypothetical protein
VNIDLFSKTLRFTATKFIFDFVFFWIGLYYFHNPFAPLGAVLVLYIFIHVSSYTMYHYFPLLYEVSNSSAKETTASLKDIKDINVWIKRLISFLVPCTLAFIFSKFMYPEFSSELIICGAIFGPLTTGCTYLLDYLFPIENN